MAQGVTPKDAFERIMLRRYGGLDDDVVAYSDQKNRIMSSSRGQASRSFETSNWMQSTGKVRLQGFGGGASDVGNHNWETLYNNSERLGSGIANMVNATMDIFGNRNSAKPPLLQGSRPGIYQTYRGKRTEYEAAQLAQRKKAARAEKENASQMAKQASANAFAYANMFDPDTQYPAVYQQAATEGPEMTPQQASWSAHVYGNLLDPNTDYPSVYQKDAPKTKKSRNPSARTPKSRRPSPINTFDPSIW